jgi:EH_Signature domain
VFAALPVGFTKLEQVVQAMGQITLVAPHEMDSIGARMRRLYMRARDTGYQSLGRGALRRMPYAMWIEGEASLEELDPQLVQAYWGKHLPEAVQNPRSAKRWLSPLLFTYCHWFNRANAEFKAFAARLRWVLQQAQGPFAELMWDLQSRLSWFTPDDVGRLLGHTLATDTAPMPQTLERLKLWPGFLGEPLCGEAFGAALKMRGEALADPAVMERVLGWSRTAPAFQTGGVARYPEHRVALADAMLSPWLNRTPSDSVRNRLLAYFIKHYGDPRLLSTNHEGHHWQGVAPAHVQLLKRWMVGDTMRGFMEILQRTADSIWLHRQRFWMAYYDRGLIDEAWLALGSIAAHYAKDTFKNAEWAQYGRLWTGAQANQSMLFMRIGDVVFMEWSHNGSLRALPVGDPQLPAMYLKEYAGQELREVYSMDFHNGMNQQPQLAHMHSEGGTWQRKARDFIARQTGVRLNDKDILG